jgi:hypothetical protein
VTRPHLATAVALGAFTLLTYFQFPGHTWLQQDSQIYVALLEHLDQPAVLARDLVCIHPHVKWTALDEIARGLHSATGWSYRTVLDSQMLLFRFCGLMGVFLLAGSAGLTRVSATFVACLFGLGLFVGGPEILTIEYEAVPRGFALLLMLAALGYGAYRRWKISVSFAAVALLYHPPTTVPYWLAVVVYALVLQRPKAMWTALAGFSAACAVLIALAATQAGEHESQPLFSVIPADIVPYLRERGKYIWVDLWKPEWMAQTWLVAAYVSGAWFRLRRDVTPELSALSAPLIVYGVLSVPLSWLVLNRMEWSMMPQFQPARAVVLLYIFAVILGAVAAWFAVRRRRWLEGFAWLLPLFALAANRLALPLITGLFSDPLAPRRLLLAVLLAVAAAFALSRRKWEPAALLVPVAAVFLIPGFGQLRNYPDLHTPELTGLSDWAGAWTRPDAMFHFADAGHATTPGIFRAAARRALYVDWKGGGQVNQNWAFAREWQRRWVWARDGRPPLRSAAEYASVGIDFVVLSPSGDLPGLHPVFANAAWKVYAVRDTSAR